MAREMISESTTTTVSEALSRWRRASRMRREASRARRVNGRC